MGRRTARANQRALRLCSERFLLGTRRLVISSTRTCRADRNDGRHLGLAPAKTHRAVGSAGDERIEDCGASYSALRGLDIMQSVADGAL